MTEKQKFKKAYRQAQKGADKKRIAEFEAFIAEANRKARKEEQKKKWSVEAT